MRRAIVCVVIAASGIGAAGCSSVQSGAVNELIRVQGEKIAAAEENSGTYRDNTRQRLRAFHSALGDLDKAMADLRAREGVHGMLFSAHREIGSMRGADAHAAAFLAGVLYQRSDGGLERAVREQFIADLDLLNDLSKQIEDSWEQIGELHALVADYSTRSSLVAIDAMALAPYFGNGGDDVVDIDAAIDRARDTNAALRRLDGIRETGASARASSWLEDLVTLLESVGQAQ